MENLLEREKEEAEFTLFNFTINQFLETHEQILPIEVESVVKSVLKKALKDDDSLQGEEKEKQLKELIAKIQEEVLRSVNVPEIQDALKKTLNKHLGIPENIPIPGAIKDPGQGANEKMLELSLKLKDLAETYKRNQNLIHGLKTELLELEELKAVQELEKKALEHVNQQLTDFGLQGVQDASKKLNKFEDEN